MRINVIDSPGPPRTICPLSPVMPNIDCAAVGHDFPAYASPHCSRRWPKSSLFHLVLMQQHRARKEAGRCSTILHRNATWFSALERDVSAAWRCDAGLSRLQDRPRKLASRELIATASFTELSRSRHRCRPFLSRREHDRSLLPIGESIVIGPDCGDADRPAIPSISAAEIKITAIEGDG